MLRAHFPQIDPDATEKSTIEKSMPGKPVLVDRSRQHRSGLEKLASYNDLFTNEFMR